MQKLTNHQKRNTKNNPTKHEKQTLIHVSNQATGIYENE
jgi:hypothetical protein